MPSDYYALLGVEPDADEEAILEAYRELAGEHHPDVSDEPDAEARFRRLNRAKDILTDPERRRAYDRLGHERFVEQYEEAARTPGGRDVATGRNGGEGPSPSTRNVDWPSGLSSLVDRLFAGVASGPASRGSRGHRGGAGGLSPFEVYLEAAFRSGAGARPGHPAAWRREAHTSRPGEVDTAAGRECPKCGGRGTFVHVMDTARGRTRRLEPCGRCDGAGTVAD